MDIFSSRHRRSGLFLVVALVSFVLSAGVGYASPSAQKGSIASTHAVIKQTSAQGQYSNAGPITPPSIKVKGAVSTPPPKAAATPTVTAETLPFTGISLVGFVALGAALVGVGIAVFRRGESRE